MFAARLGRRTPAARTLAALLASTALPGCAQAPDPSGAWGFLGVALILVAAIAYLLGRAHRQRRMGIELRQARAEAREWRQLQPAWRWQTDASHGLALWQGPDDAAGAECALFGRPLPVGTAPEPAATDELSRRLRAEQPFADLCLLAPVSGAGARRWSLTGVPRLDDEGRFCGFSGTARPLDRHEALEAAAGIAPTLVGALQGVAVWAVHQPGGWQVSLANPAARQIWPELAPGAMLSDLVPALPPPLREALTDALADPTRLRAADSEGWQLLPGANVPDRSLLILRQTAASIDGAAASAESDSFSFTVSHDLRAPIRVVEGFTRIVKEDYGRLLDRVGNDHLDRVLGAAARMNLMIDALLTMARLSSQPLARQPVDLSQLAAYVIDDLRRTAPEREVEVEIEPGLVTLGDPTLLRLVLENLLGNAWKYSARAVRAQISMKSIAHANGRALVVRDNGAGFDMRSADRLFGLFQRLHSASEFPGHGVGLASVRRIVTRHGGTIWAEAEPGRGAAFFFTLGG